MARRCFRVRRTSGRVSPSDAARVAAVIDDARLAVVAREVGARVDGLTAGLRALQAALLAFRARVRAHGHAASAAAELAAPLAVRAVAVLVARAVRAAAATVAGGVDGADALVRVLCGARDCWKRNRSQLN